MLLFSLSTQKVCSWLVQTAFLLLQILYLAIFILPKILLLLSIVIIFLIHIMLLFSSLSFQKGVILTRSFLEGLAEITSRKFLALVQEHLRKSAGAFEKGMLYVSSF